MIGRGNQANTAIVLAILWKLQKKIDNQIGRCDYLLMMFIGLRKPKGIDSNNYK